METYITEGREIEIGETEVKLDGYAIHMLAQIGLIIKNPIIIPPKYDGSQFKYHSSNIPSARHRSFDFGFFAATGIPLFR